jgi:transposase
MSKLTKFVGLDVHKDSISIAVCWGHSPAEDVARIPHDLPRLLKVLDGLGDRKVLRVAYEAGPTGYGLQRFLASKGIDCVVVAATPSAERKQRKNKRDPIDAKDLATQLRYGSVRPVAVPDPETEAVRDLERLYDDVQCRLGDSKRHLLSFFLRQGRRYDGGQPWTEKHLAWIRKQEFKDPAHVIVLNEYLDEVLRQRERLATIHRQLTERIQTWSGRDLVTALQAVRGISVLTATALVAEVVDFKRFKTAGHLMSFLGLVPSEYSSGDTVRRGRITRAGNTHVRRLLVQAAKNAYHRPVASEALRKRAALVSPEVRQIALRARNRLHHRYWALAGRKVHKNKVAIALARELAGFIWSIAQQTKLLAA